MAISVSHLSKHFGTQRAVDDLSFQVQDGEILGFLGPNGAGKSTTMKMLTGFLQPDGGTAEVAGYDIQEDSLAARRQIGYLPEHNPLHHDMYIREYLEWVARFYPLTNRRKHVQEMIERVGLTREQHKRIGQLSKGYRQRVGLAQALLHDPQVLILDEPTSGLDPNQLADIRALIRDLGRDKTILFSTHIMQEVAALCDRVAIIHRGRLVADGPVAELQQRLSGSQQVWVQTTKPIDGQAFAAIPGIQQVLPASDQTSFRLVVEEGQDVRAQVFRTAVSQGWELLELRLEERGVGRSVPGIDERGEMRSYLWIIALVSCLASTVATGQDPLAPADGLYMNVREFINRTPAYPWEEVTGTWYISPADGSARGQFWDARTHMSLRPLLTCWEGDCFLLDPDRTDSITLAYYPLLEVGAICVYRRTGAHPEMVPIRAYNPANGRPFLESRVEKVVTYDQLMMWRPALGDHALLDRENVRRWTGRSPERGRSSELRRAITSYNRLQAADSINEEKD